MTNWRFWYIALPAVLLWFSGLAQISPGELSRPHAQLEGISNCTKCHILGQKVSSEKCIDCHKEIKVRLGQNQGFHASKAVKGKTCITCHSDHHGRDFNMIRLDEQAFDHNLTGYPLTGSHKKTDCRDCHKSDFISDPNLKKKKTTFLGLKDACVSCHTDVHQKTLSSDCAKCHSTEAFKPASRFDHNKTKFALQGKHVETDCLQCHKKEVRNVKDFQRFAGVLFQNCNACHQDTHENQLGANCKECHVEDSFTSLRGLSRFNHGNTLFPLKGRHKALDCNQCHALQGVTPLTVFQDRKGVSATNCVECHADVHEGRLGNNCSDCHTEEGFLKVKAIDDFNHSLTNFPLAGKHRVVDCKDCHKSDYTEPLPHQNCASCHSDYHEGQFLRKDGLVPDCAVCHTVEGFETSSYSFEMHQLTRFPLTGAHEATPCSACHKKEEKWEFKNLGLRCADCHEDIHQGEIQEKYYPQKECEVCHMTTNWVDNRFDHNFTSFPLLGVHQKQACGACHLRDSNHPFGRFRELPASCGACHADQHNRQFEQNGETNCKRCHSQDNWMIPRFNHNKTAFSLDGQHAKVGCEACHKPIVFGDRLVIQYKFKSFRCEDCHN